MRWTIHLGVLLAVALAGCAESDAPIADARPAPQEIVKDGAIVRIGVDRTELTPADRLTVRIERVSPPGFAPAAGEQGPRTGDELGSFTIADVRRERPTLDEMGRRVDVVEYILLPFLPGEEAIPPMEWTFAPIADHEMAKLANALATLVVTTEPIEITVHSLLNGGEAALAEQKGVVGVARGPLWPWIAGGATGLAILAASTALFVGYTVRRRRGQRPETPAHVEALRAMQDLESRRLAQEGRFDPYFTRLSQILRRYIERRFEVHAPALTTEEFLHQARTSRAIRAEYVRDLERFLRLADLVKFAKHAPAMEEAGQAHDTARAFIESTAQVESPLQEGARA